MRALSPGILLLALTGCSWIGKAEYDDRLTQVDDDGDGVPASEDCNDGDASVSPAREEVWYDGIDEACDGGDDYDQDGDGDVPAEFVGLVTAGVDGSGALPGGDCDDTDPMISPEQPDTWYDGVDQDCDGADDYDEDGDHYVPDAYVGLATTGVDGTGSLPGGDCDDLLDTVNPGATDAWYDGIDSDCAGNDDWDQDGDGFVATEQYADYGPTTYVDGSGGLPNGDCDDTDPDRYPAAPDAWYDGIDSDCAQDDDYDQDGDGFSDLRGGGDDCDDQDPLAHPGATEVLGDGHDYDCDGGNDTFSLDPVEGFTWARPHDPVFSESSDRIYLSVAAQEIDTGTSHYYDSAVALLWLNDDPGDGRDGVAAWSPNTSDPADYTLGDGQGFIATDDYLYGVLGLDYGTSRALRLVRYDLATGARTAANANGTDGYTAYDDISIALDSAGALNAIGCEDDTEVLQYIRVSSTWAGGFAADVETPGVGAADCALDLHDDSGHVYTSEQGGIWDYPFSPTDSDPVFTGSEYTADYAPLDLDIPADWASPVLVIADATTDSVVLLDGTTVTTVGDGDVPLQADVYQDAAGTYYVAYVVPGGGVHLAWGDGTTGFTEVRLATDIANVEDVAVWESGGYVMVGVTGDDDVAVGIAGI